MKRFSFDLSQSWISVSDTVRGRMTSLLHNNNLIFSYFSFLFNKIKGVSEFYFTLVYFSNDFALARPPSSLEFEIEYEQGRS